jgi:uncharacterized protein (DUF1778 family)
MTQTKHITKPPLSFEAQIRLSERDIKLVRQAATQLEISVSEFVRRATKEKVVRVLVEQNPTELNPEN